MKMGWSQWWRGRNSSSRAGGRRAGLSTAQGGGWQADETVTVREQREEKRPPPTSSQWVQERDQPLLERPRILGSHRNENQETGEGPVVRRGLIRDMLPAGLWKGAALYREAFSLPQPYMSLGLTHKSFFPASLSVLVMMSFPQETEVQPRNATASRGPCGGRLSGSSTEEQHGSPEEPCSHQPPTDTREFPTQQLHSLSGSTNSQGAVVIMEHKAPCGFFPCDISVCNGEKTTSAGQSPNREALC